MDCVIITGTSRGLGESLARKLILNGAMISCISRNKNNELIRLAGEHSSFLEYYEYNLAGLDGIGMLMESIFNKIKTAALSSITLINNASTLDPIMPAGRAFAIEIINNYNLNLIAPVLLSSLFIRHTEKMDIEKRIINITSGAAQKPYYGWSCYCSSKAGLEHFSRSAALEQDQRKNPVKIISFNPGIMDTDMQKKIRTSSKENFSDVDRFIEFKNDGKLLSPDFTAGKVIEIMRKKDVVNGGTINIKDL